MWAAAAGDGFSALAAGQSAPLSACPTMHWVGVWAADPTGIVGSGTSDQTLRVVLTPHIGGTALRIHLSNRFGTSSVTFARVSVAVRRSGAALVDGSSRAVTFGGRSGATVAAAGEATSDPVALPFGAFQDLAVSLYVAGASGPVTGHLISRERSYATAPAAGDRTSDASASAFADTTTMGDYVAGVDAMAPSDVGAAVLFGDSLTDGYESNGVGTGEDQAGMDLGHRYPDYLARRLLAQPGGPRFSVVNAGVSGNRLLAGSDDSLAGRTGLARLGADVIGVAGVSTVIVLEGINDISNHASAGQVTGALAEIVGRLHGAGLRVLLGTIPPTGSGLLNLGSLLPPLYIDTPENEVRVAVNAWMRSGTSGADGVVDFDAALRGGASPNELAPTLDSGDHVHPNYLGYSRMADAVDLSSLGGAYCAASSRAATRLSLTARSPSAGRLRISGVLRTAQAAGCVGATVVVRVLSGRHTILKRHAALTAACRFEIKPIAARGRLEVRVGFPGSATLLAARSRRVFVRTR